MDGEQIEYRDRSRILFLIGAALLAMGLVSALLGPIEMYCFYLFSEGGRFHYPGFGFGSFMFANLACQIAGYYLIALLCIPLGYAHLRLRRWARVVSLALIWCWLILGIPLTVVFLFILFASKELPLFTAIMVMIALGGAYLAAPWVLLRFYRSRDVQRTFESRNPRPHWTEGLPTSVLTLGMLFLFYAIALHALILFNGIFPLFGFWLSGLDGILFIALAILFLALLAWGCSHLKKWAWWGMLFFLSALTASGLLTLFKTSYPELLSLMNFPPTEMEILDGLPLQSYHFAIFCGLPLILTLILLLTSRESFQANDRADAD
jgi:hypothetical protein